MAISLMLGLYLAAAIFSASSQLHHWLHHDSDRGSHQCVVTLITKAQLFAGVAETKAVVAVALIVSIPILDPVRKFSAVDYRISASRAPPLVSSSLS
jgi:hypothetical protein